MPESAVSVELLADHPELIEPVGILRWTEWGYDDPSTDAWVSVTAREAGRDELPVTWVALDRGGAAVGVVGLDVADDALTEEERTGRTPWLVGLVVRRDARRQGIGRALLRALEERARERGHDRVWVVTGSDAVDFYRACGWSDVQRLVTGKESLPSTVLTRTLT